jgi:epoxyqueuosine reductase
MCILPDRIKELWGLRLYGCETCQEVCPFNRGLARTTAIHRGVTGPGISITELLGMSITRLRTLFKPTPMGMSWINPLALVRNALLAAGNSGNKLLIPAVTPYLAHEHEVLRDTARWAMGRLLAC